jgi:hypothetical protein
MRVFGASRPRLQEMLDNHILELVELFEELFENAPQFQ